MKYLLVILFLFVPCHAQSYVTTWASASYAPATNQVTGYAYTEPAYVNALYYNTYVNGSLYTFGGTSIDYDSANGGSSMAEINLSATGVGCDYYQITSSHYQTMVYWVEDYWYDNQYWTGYWDEYNYNFFNGDYPEGGTYYMGYTYNGPGPSASFYSDHIIFGNSEHWSSGKTGCQPGLKLRDISPERGAPGATNELLIKGNGFTAGATLEPFPANSNITFSPVNFQNATRMKVNITPAHNTSAGDVPIRVNVSGTTPSNTKNFDVRVPYRIRVLSDVPVVPGPGNQEYQCNPLPSIRAITFEVVDSNNDRVGKVHLGETFLNVTTNTCGNGQPQAAPCTYASFDVPNGAERDVITTKCPAPPNGGSCGYDIEYEWRWCPTGGTAVNVGSFDETVHFNGITVNGNTSGFSAGTYINP